MRQGWEREKDRKRGIVGERKIGREKTTEREKEDRGEVKIERET